MNIDRKTAIKLAKETNGYAYGFQLLGDLFYKANAKELNNKILKQFDTRLDENVYEKVWKSLTKTEKEVLYAIAKAKLGSILEALSLSKIGVLDIENRGYIYFSLPRFKEFIDFN